jgi:hypothetical protein
VDARQWTGMAGEISNKTYNIIRTMPKFIVESDIDVRTFVRQFQDRQVIAECNSIDEAYEFIKQYIEDTVDVYHHFARHTICSKEEMVDLVGSDKPVATNVVLGHFEDTLYITKK